MTYLVSRKMEMSEEHRAKLKKKNSNLRFAKTRLTYVTYFRKLYAGMDTILKKKYNFTDDTYVSVLYMNTIDTPRWKNYRTSFKPYYKGDLAGLRKKIRKFYRKKVWPQNAERLKKIRQGKSINYVSDTVILKLKRDVLTNAHIYFYKKFDKNVHRSALTKIEVDKVMENIYPKVIDRYTYFSNIDLKRKPTDKEYKFFLKNIAYNKRSKVSG